VADFTIYWREDAYTSWEAGAGDIEWKSEHPVANWDPTTPNQEWTVGPPRN